MGGTAQNVGGQTQENMEAEGFCRKKDFISTDTKAERDVAKTTPPQGNEEKAAILPIQLALRKLFERMELGTNRNRKVSERTLLLERLIHKVQPDLSQQEVRERVEVLKDKFRSFDLEQLRQLVGADEEGMGAAKEGMGTAKEGTRAAKEGGKEGMGAAKEGTRTGKEGMGASKKGMGAVKEGIRTAKEGTGDAKGGTGTAKEGMGAAKEGIMGAAKEGMKVMEEELDEEERDLFEQADLDDESLAALEEEVNEELKELLSELGIPAEGGWSHEVLVGGAFPS